MMLPELVLEIAKNKQTFEMPEALGYKFVEDSNAKTPEEK